MTRGQRRKIAAAVQAAAMPDYDIFNYGLVKRDEDRETKETVKVEFLVGAEGAKSMYDSFQQITSRPRILIDDIS